MKTSIATVFLAAFSTSAMAQSFEVKGNSGSVLKAESVASFDNPWAMTFLPDGTILVTEKTGKLLHVTQSGDKKTVRNVPKAVVGGQGGLGDVVLHPDYAKNGLIYLSLIESLDGGATRGAVVVRGKLDLSGEPTFKNEERIWTQKPKMRGKGHFSHRIAFGPKGSMQEGKMFITSGDRQRQSPAQNWDMALGKIIRLNQDGSVPEDNPFQDKGALAKTYWTTGHRNLLGISFDAENRLWAHEMGPAHGDEINLIEPGNNYGWPVVSEGNNYNGTKIPVHSTRPEFVPPKAYWVPSIAPAGLTIYSGKEFADWQGNAFIGGLVSRALIRVKLDGNKASEAERFSWGKRIREVELGPDGALWVLEDKRGGRLVKLTK